jgi:hypothetical protein
MRVYFTPWARAHLTNATQTFLMHGEPRDARLAVYAKSANGPFHAQLSLADGTGAEAIDADCIRAIERVLIATTKKNVDKLA